MAYGFDVVPVWVKKERAKIIGVVVGANTGCAVIAPAGTQTRLPERVYLRAFMCTKCDVNTRRRAGRPVYPE